MRSMKCDIWLFAVALVSFAPPSAAVDPHLAERWTAEVSSASALLKAEQYPQAIRILEPLTDEMLDNLDSGKAAGQVLGTVIAYRAIAYAGLGRNDDALWYWDVAVAMFPPFANSDLSPYGRAGAFLKNNPLSTRIIEPAGATSGVTPAKLRYRTRIHVPRGSTFHHGKFLVTVQITTSGAAAAPRIVSDPPTPMLAFNAFEALRKWRFEPASKDGVALPSVLQLTLSYSLP
jgi:TonB-like protein